jgi:hypothetical protein
MKIAALFFALLFFQLHPSGQLECVVANARENIIHVGIDNPMEVAVEKTSKSSICLTTDNGTITKTENGYMYIMHPVRVGETKINVCKISKRDTIVVCTKFFRAKKLPSPVAYIGNLSEGVVSKKQLTAMGGIISRIEGFDINMPLEVKEYLFVVIRDNTAIGVSKNFGPRYNDKTKALLQNLQAGDNVIVTGITVKMSYELRKVAALEYTIIE